MKKNLGNMDRLVRIIFAAAITVLFFSKLISGTVGYILLGLAIISLGTSLAGYCLAYSIFGINTRKQNHNKEMNVD